MTYYCDTVWNVTFNSDEDKEKCKKELREEYTWEFAPLGDSWLNNVGESSEETQNGLTLSGATWGKLYGWMGHGEVESIFAKYATGTVEFNAFDSGDGAWIVVFDGGVATTYQGAITYSGYGGHTVTITESELEEMAAVPVLLGKVLENFYGTPEEHDAVSEASSWLQYVVAQANLKKEN